MFENKRHNNDSDILVKSWQCGPLGVNCYLVASIENSGDNENKEAVLIDPGDYEGEIAEFVHQRKIKPKLIIATHGHLDHIMGISGFKKLWGVQVACHAEDIPFFSQPDPFIKDFLGGTYEPIVPEQVLKDGDKIFIGSHAMEVIHTPGHTPGSICLLMPPYLFSGDTLFHAGVGRTDLAGGDYNALIRSIRNRLFLLPDKLLLLPGHGYTSKLGEEKKIMTLY